MSALRCYHVSIRRGSQVVRSFEAMASDSVSCVQQHICLLEEGEKLDVMGMADWNELQRDRAALIRQIDRPDELTRACMGEFNHG